MIGRFLRLTASQFLFLAVLPGCPAQSPPPSPIPSSNWINVRNYGAKGDGKTDDRNAILAAISAAIQGFGTHVVYFPPTDGMGYLIGSDFKLPFPGNKWIELYLDNNLLLGGSLEVVNHYYIHGHSGGQTSNFDTFQTSMIGVGSKSFPAAIHITRRGNITIENLSLKYVGGRADGILVEPSPDGLGQSSMITIKNVHVSMAGDNLAGIPLHIKGGFGFYIEGGGYGSRAEGQQPSILIEDDPKACNNTGIIRVRDVFLEAHGIKLRANCGGVGNITFDGLLYESGLDPLLTIEERWPGFLFGLRLKDCNIADSRVPAIENKSPRVYGVSLDNCAISGDVLTTGRPIDGLDIWSPTVDGRIPKVAQTTGYVMRTPYKTISTIPVVQTPDQRATTSSKKPRGPGRTQRDEK